MINVPLYQEDIDLIKEFYNSYRNHNGDHMSLALELIRIMHAKISRKGLAEQGAPKNED